MSVLRPLLAAALLVCAAVPVAAQTRVTCSDYGTTVVCDNGRVYDLRGTAPGPIVAPQPAPPVVVVPSRREPPILSEDLKDDFDDLIRDYGRAARRACRGTGGAGTGLNDQCRRTEIEQRVLATGDAELIRYYRLEVRNR